VRIISRREWGARNGAGRHVTKLPAAEVWLHHSATVAPDLVEPWDDDIEAIRTIERIGAERFGMEYGFPYTFGITPAGLVFEGHDIARTGAHTKGHNTAGRAICWVGNYADNRPTEAMVQATAELLIHGHAQGWWAAPQLTGGHRDVKATACPGQHAYALIPEINRRAAGGDTMPTPREIVDALLGTKLPDLYRPGLPPLPVADLIAWGTAHAAHARDAADSAATRAARCEELLGQALGTLQRIETHLAKDGGQVPDLRPILEEAVAQLGPFTLTTGDPRE
jgi:hypothetical protein